MKLEELYMTRSDQIKQIIRKAIDNGWNDGKQYLDNYDLYTPEIIFTILFDHDFARAYYGIDPTKKIIDDYGCIKMTPNWRYRLQQQILAEDVVTFIWKFYESQ